MKILYLDLDTLRPDHLGCYGYKRNTSPNIDLVAAQGMRLTNCHCSDAPCLPSRAALMTGRFGFHTGIVNHGGACADRLRDGRQRGFRDSLAGGGNLTNVMRDSGLHTCYFGGFGERHSAYWFYAGFHEIHDTAKGGMESAEDVTPAVLDWIARNAARDNWYLHVNYWDPHTPYRAPADFGNPFKNDPLPEWMNENILQRHWLLPGPHGAQDVNMYDNKTNPRYPRHPGDIPDMTAFRKLVDGYDCGIRYMDRHIGKLFDALKQQGVLDHLVIIISSDHGENLGELGIYAEHGTADLITTRIPMIIRWPGRVRENSVDHGLHYNLDLLPTLAEMLRRPAKPYWDGTSFADTLENGKHTGREELILSQCCHVCQRSVRWGDHLYMRTFHDGFHLFPPQQLYNVEKDPHEQWDMAPSRPDLCREGERRLARWHARMTAAMCAENAVDPMQTVLEEGGPFHARGQLSAYVERLKATGRGDTVEELMRRHPGEFTG